MLEIGEQVRFSPYAYLRCRGNEAMSRAQTPEEYALVTGTVIYINERHGWFLVEYGESKQRMGFKFQDLFDAVTIVGKRIIRPVKRMPSEMYSKRVVEYRKEAEEVARDFGYSNTTIKKIRNAKTDREITNILVTARKKKFDADI